MTHLINKPPLIIILGPTASGKSSLAIKLAQKFDGFIISADSRQIYRYLDVGTAKVANLSELSLLKKQRTKLLKTAKSPLDYVLYFNGIAHYMMDIIEPTEHFSVAEYKNWVYRIIKNHSQVPILVGGTGLYIDAVVNNLQFAKTDPALRRKLENQLKKEGIDKLYQQLIKLDPQAKKIVPTQNPRRVIRALEICLLNKKPFSRTRTKGASFFNVLKIGLNQPRQELYQKIDKRVAAWLAMGWMQEVQSLVKTKQVSLVRLQEFGLGYKIISEYLTKNNLPVVKKQTSQSFSGWDQKNCHLSAEYRAMIQKIKWSLHAYARRQLIWFRRDKDIHWIANYNEAEKLIENFL